jgi:hypothetical protein
MGKYADSMANFLDALNDYTDRCMDLYYEYTNKEPLRERHHAAKVLVQRLYNETLTTLQLSEYKDDVLGRLRPLRGKLRESVCQTIEWCFRHNLTVDDAAKYVKCTEEYNPRLTEEVALERMRVILSKYKSEK